MNMMRKSALSAVEVIARSHRLRPLELLPWLIVIACFFLFPAYLALGSQILVAILFTLSVDLILGYAGIVTLGHAAFFGLGAYTAGILAANGWGEALSGLVIAGVVAASLGAATGAIILRTHGLTLLMLTLALNFMLLEAANKAHWLTGGADGLQGMKVWPLLGLFRFDMFGRTAYIYCAVILFFGWIFARILVHSPFGRSLTGIRENVTRMHAVGSPVRARLVTIYTISAGLAGIAGALQAQTTQFVGLAALEFHRSGEVLVMLILGGIGRIYGAFIGPAIYMIAQDELAKIDTVYWLFWIGLLLVLVVMFARGGVLGLCDQIVKRVTRRAS